MKRKNLVNLPVFIALSFLVVAACVCGNITPSQPEATPQPQQPPSTQPPSTQPPSNSGNTGSSGQLTTFTDKNKYYQIDVPSDWKYSQTVDKTNNYYYIDQFKSPDGNALVENIAYDDGTAFSGADNGRFALYLLNNFYSNTGKEGDIRVSDDSIQKDGSERLTWASKGGGYSGISYFEVRNRTTFLMFTIEWANDYKDQYFDMLGNVVSSYTTP